MNTAIKWLSSRLPFLPTLAIRICDLVLHQSRRCNARWRSGDADADAASYFLQRNRLPPIPALNPARNQSRQWPCLPINRPLVKLCSDLLAKSQLRSQPPTPSSHNDHQNFASETFPFVSTTPPATPMTAYLTPRSPESTSAPPFIWSQAEHLALFGDRAQTAPNSKAKVCVSRSTLQTEPPCHVRKNRQCSRTSPSISRKIRHISNLFRITRVRESIKGDPSRDQANSSFGQRTRTPVLFTNQTSANFPPSFLQTTSNSLLVSQRSRLAPHRRRKIPKPT
ncbi:hypothetical protein BJ742DRAFT_216409 [Cladochytrium replicatum]|nr:hypothetical protein BJ742DRAFT_216409 [Cladochytrium replicatum]